MAILITGHKGFIGQNMMTAFPDVIGYEWGDGDICLKDISAVIHLGAISSTACNDWDLLKQQNVDFSKQLLDACSERKIHFQFTSSASVYGVDAKSFNESDAVQPANLYAKSKRAVEEYILSKEWPMPVQAFRYFNVHGKHEDHKDQPSPHSLFKRQAKQSGVITLFEDSRKYKRDFIPVNNVVNIHKKFLQKSESGVFNVGSGRATSFYDIAHSVATLTGARVKEIPMPDHMIKTYQKFTKADMVKTNNILNMDE
jgi:ADP-L-glycero-D-manno-heptose 6-epimerase